MLPAPTDRTTRRASPSSRGHAAAPSARRRRRRPAGHGMAWHGVGHVRASLHVGGQAGTDQDAFLTWRSAERTHAATPHALGDDIDVPWYCALPCAIQRMHTAEGEGGLKGIFRSRMTERWTAHSAADRLGVGLCGHRTYGGVCGVARVTHLQRVARHGRDRAARRAQRRHRSVRAGACIGVGRTCVRSRSDPARAAQWAALDEELGSKAASHRARRRSRTSRERSRRPAAAASRTGRSSCAWRRLCPAWGAQM